MYFCVVTKRVQLWECLENKGSNRLRRLFVLSVLLCLSLESFASFDKSVLVDKNM